MAHRNRWFTELKNDDLPVRYVNSPDGILYATRFVLKTQEHYQ